MFLFVCVSSSGFSFFNHSRLPFFFFPLSLFPSSARPDLSQVLAGSSRGRLSSRLSFFEPLLPSSLGSRIPTWKGCYESEVGRLCASDVLRECVNPLWTNRSSGVCVSARARECVFSSWAPVSSFVSCRLICTPYNTLWALTLCFFVWCLAPLACACLCACAHALNGLICWAKRYRERKLRVDSPAAVNVQVRFLVFFFFFHNVLR